MKTSSQVYLAAVLLLSSLATSAQDSPRNNVAPPGTVPLSSLIANVAKMTGRKFVLAPRVKANVALVGQAPSSVTYGQLLTILDTYGFAAVDTGEDIQVVPDALARAEPLPIVTDRTNAPGGEYVTAVFHVKSISAGSLVPILRPLVPRSGYLAAMPCQNALVMVDRLANVRRVETVAKALDAGAPIKPPSCTIPGPPR